MDNEKKNSIVNYMETAIDNLNRAKDLTMEMAISSKLQDIVLAVANHYGLEPEELMADTGDKRFRRPRMIVAYLSSKLTQAPYKIITNVLGSFSEGEVARKCQIIEAELPEAEWLRNDVNAIVEAVRKLDERNQAVHDDEKELLTCYRLLSDNAKVEIQGLIKYLRCSES